MQRLFMALALLLGQGAFSVAAFAAVNINTASLEEFVALHKGLGPAKAQAIIDYRKANGPFKSVDDLKHVKGIGAKRLDKLRPELTVGTVPKSAVVGAAKAEARVAAPAARGEIRTAADGGKK
jgi:competence protein ComEA